MNYLNDIGCTGHISDYILTIYLAQIVTYPQDQTAGYYACALLACISSSFAGTESL